MAGRAVPAPVRVLAVSDEVDDAIAADPGPARGADLIVACGDLPFEYLGSLMNALDIPLVFVPGNHDPDLSGYRSSRAGLTLRAGMPVGEPWPAGAVNADGHVVDAAGLRLAGLGGGLRYRDGPNQYTDRQQAPPAPAPPAPAPPRRQAGLGGCPPSRDGPNQYTDRQQARRALALRAAARWRRQRDGRGVDVLLTHAPPRGVGDGDDPPHRGVTAPLSLTAVLHPAALLHGHVHPVRAYGVQAESGRIGRTVVCNVTGWHVLEIEPGTGEAKMLHGAREQGRRDAR